MRTCLALLLLAVSPLLTAQTGSAQLDYLRFIPPDAEIAAGFEVKQVASLIDAMIVQMMGPDARKSAAKGMDALRQIDRLWLAARDSGSEGALILVTGRFERGSGLEALKAPGMIQVFVGGPNAMLIGSEKAVRAALRRLNAPQDGDDGWVGDQARQLAPDHDFWLAMQPRADLQQVASQLQGMRQFSLAAKLHDETRLDGELVTVSETIMDKLMATVDEAKARMIKDNPKTRATLDKMTVERDGDTLRFSAKGGKLSTQQFSTEIARQLHGMVSAMMPTPGGGALQRPQAVAAAVETPSAAVADEKLLAVKKGMKRAEVVGLIGKPATVSSISGLEVQRETWTYRLESGKKVTLRLDDGVVTAGTHL